MTWRVSSKTSKTFGTYSVITLGWIFQSKTYCSMCRTCSGPLKSACSSTSSIEKKLQSEKYKLYQLLSLSPVKKSCLLIGKKRYFQVLSLIKLINFLEKLWRSSKNWKSSRKPRLSMRYLPLKIENGSFNSIVRP